MKLCSNLRTIGDNLRMNIRLVSDQNSDKLINLLKSNSRLIHFKEVTQCKRNIHQFS